MDLLLRKNEELSAILEASRVLTASFDLDKNLVAAMGILSSHLEMQRGCVFLLDPVSRELRIVAATDCRARPSGAANTASAKVSSAK